MAIEVKAPERKLIIPSPAEAILPSNMPSEGQIEAWDKNLHRQFKKKVPSPGEVESVFTPFCLFPEHDVTKNLVEYRYNVAMTTTPDDKPNAVIAGIKQIREQTFFADVKLFLDQFVAV